MPSLPDAISTIYQPARTHDVYSWSFGAVRAVRNTCAPGWRETRFTLDDEAIFGPRLDYQCACGKHHGREYDRMICDQCGVKITTTDSRCTRFGHIDFSSQVTHPLSEPPVLLKAFPVLPAAFRESTGGRALNGLYEDVLRFLSPFNADAVGKSLSAIAQLLLPIVVDSTRWNVRDASLLARGLALVLRQEPSDGRCAHCGFPLDGLREQNCPRCGKKLEPE
jgi:Zn finger protein HypA/HybF involved in hydrogenase expression